MIRALDSRLVAAAQWVVDLTQRQPHTLGGLSVALSAVACCARAGSVALPGWVVGLALLSYALVFSLSLSPALFRFLDYRPIRILQLVSVALDLFVLLSVVAVPPLCAAAGAACSASQTGYGLSLLRSLASLACWCFAACRPPDPADPSSMRLALCPTCGNKRCPRAHNHTLACTNSNAPGQPGSSWEHVRPVHETVACAPRRPGKQTAADREMLEMAAKAAGILGAFSYFSDAIGWCFFRGDTGASWSPHINDRDCARLEAALGISVNWLNLGVRCSKEFDVSPDIVARVPYSEHGGDKQATRRHCVLLVAAAIGRAMP